MGLDSKRNDGSTQSDGQAVALPPILRNAWILILACVSVSTAMHLFWFFVKHAPGHYAWPFSLNSQDRFGDFTIFKVKYAHWHQPDFFSTGFPINYPAPIVDFFEVFFRWFRFPTVAFVIFTTLCFAVPCVLFARALRARGIAPARAAFFSLTLFVFSWPALLLIDGANMEVAVWVATACGFWGLATGRENVAAACFGLAGSFKLFPFILLAIFFSEKKYGKLLLGVATMAAMTLLSLWILGPTVHQAYAGIAYGLTFFKNFYMAQWHSGENGVDHSIFALIKMLMLLSHLKPKGTVFLFPLQVYLWVTALGGIALYLVRIRHMPVLNQALLLTIASIWLTAFSGDGTLIHLYAPLAMLVFLAIDAYKRGIEVPGLQTALLTLTFIVTPVSFLIVTDHRFEGQVKCLALGCLFYLGIRYPLGAPLASTRSADELAYPNASKIDGIVLPASSSPADREEAQVLVNPPTTLSLSK